VNFTERVAQIDEDLDEILEKTRWNRERTDEIEKKIDALCRHLLPTSGAGSLESHDKMRRRGRRMNDEEPTGAIADGQDEFLRRLGKLEAWVEVVMQTLAGLGLETLLIELDEARGADFDEAGDSCTVTVGEAR
jgi:hypothetical protein